VVKTYLLLVFTSAGWEVRSLSCGNNSTFVVADDEVITWGPSPTYGELGYGDPSNNPKSSTVPKIVDSLTVRFLCACSVLYSMQRRISAPYTMQARPLLIQVTIPLAGSQGIHGCGGPWVWNGDSRCGER
jgi:hypothetical protein